MADIWIVSDTHFGHANIIRFCYRPFSSVEEMDHVMYEEWNKVVKEGDEVYHLGDVYFGGGYRDRRDVNRLLRGLRGRKRLVLGNHDNGRDRALDCFQRMYSSRLLKDFGLLFTHIPVHSSTFDMQPGIRLNVHGHIHDKKIDDGRYFNACVEHHNYRPINLDELRR